MRSRRGKILFFICFVLLFLVIQSRFRPDSKITAKRTAGVNSVRSETVKATSTVLLIEKKVEKPSAKNISHQYYKVAKVVDGDTIDIIMNGRTERLRLIGINTPEIVDPRKPVECFGREASDNAKKLLSNEEARVEGDASQDDRDKYGRLLRYVWRRDGLFYNLEVIKDGFAHEYTYQLPYIYQKDFKAAQKYAEENKLGLWADGVCSQKNISTVKNNLTAVLMPVDKNCVIKGNISSGGVKIYHLPNCPYYKQTVINASQGEKWFCTEAQALAAGWRKAGNCQ